VHPPVYKGTDDKTIPLDPIERERAFWKGIADALSVGPDYGKLFMQALYVACMIAACLFLIVKDTDMTIIATLLAISCQLSLLRAGK
jgi:hypothetical protein